MHTFKHNFLEKSVIMMQQFGTFKFCTSPFLLTYKDLWLKKDCMKLQYEHIDSFACFFTASVANIGWIGFINDS